jgi:hypothetical protein
MPSPWRRRQPATLPESLRDRLLAIPHDAPSPRRLVARLENSRDLDTHWLLASPLAAIAASFLVAAVATALLGDPYQVGAATLEEVRDEVRPVAARVYERATRLADVVGSVGDVAVEALPRAGSAASRAIARTLDDGSNRDQPSPRQHRREALP